MISRFNTCAMTTFLLTALVCVGGCRTFTSPARNRHVTSANKNGLYLIDYEATRRGTYVVQDGSNAIRIAAEPPPDVAFESTSKLTASLGDAVLKTDDAKLSGQVIETLTKLTERTQSVVIMRDAMFRLAEMHLNGAIDNEQYAFLYNKALAGALAIAADEPRAEMIIESFVKAEYEDRRQRRLEDLAKLTTQVRTLSEAQPTTPQAREAQSVALQTLIQELAKLSADPIASPNLAESLFTDHPNVPPIAVEGKTAIRLALRDEAGTRATNNFNADWNGAKSLRVVVQGVPDDVVKEMSFQLKRDEKWASDINIGTPFKSGATVKVEGATRLYVAERDFETGKVLQQAPDATILLVEVGLDPSKVPQ